jgi:hypothetical protein
LFGAFPHCCGREIIFPGNWNVLGKELRTQLPLEAATGTSHLIVISILPQVVEKITLCGFNGGKQIFQSSFYNASLFVWKCLMGE